MEVIFEVVTGTGCYMAGSPVSTVGSKSDDAKKEKRQNSHGTVAGSGQPTEQRSSTCGS